MRVVRWIIGSLLLLVFGVFTSIVWLAFHEERRTDVEPPLIRADAEPYRQKPVNRGGLAVLNKDSALVQSLDNGPEQGIVERILPAPEPAPKSAFEVIKASVDGSQADTQGAVIIERETPPKPEIDAGTDAALEEVSSIEEVVVAALPEALESPELDAVPQLPDGLDVDGADAQSSGDKLAGEEAAGEEVAIVEAVDPVVAEVEAEVEEIAGDGLPVVEAPDRSPERQTASLDQGQGGNDGSSGSASGEIKSEIEPGAAPVNVSALNAALADAGPFRLQLAAFRTEEQAKEALDRLRPEISILASDIGLNIIRAETDNGVYFRVQTDRGSSKGGAVRFCEVLKQTGGDCFVTVGGS